MYTRKGTDTLVLSCPLKGLLSSEYQVLAKNPKKEYDLETMGGYFEAEDIEKGGRESKKEEGKGDGRETQEDKTQRGKPPFPWGFIALVPPSLLSLIDFGEM